MAKLIKKVIFPVAGLGTRFLPATKANPKEMLPIVDKPLIQYAVEEAVAAGIKELVFVTGRNKRSIEDHFDKAYELETELAHKQKTAMLTLVQDIVPAEVSCVYIRQSEALGLGHAVLCARPVVGNEPFAVILADDLIDAQPGAIRQMMDVYSETGVSVLGVERVSPHETASYGIVKVNESTKRYYAVEHIVEKPKPQEAPSDLAVVGRYILNGEIFDYLAQTGAGAGGEIQLTDGIASLMKNQPVMALPLQGKRYDCGSKLGYLKATLNYALQHDEVGAEFAAYLKNFYSKQD